MPTESGNTPARLRRHDTSRARRHARMDSKARKPHTGGSTMTAQPADRIPASGPDTGSYEVIHLGGQAAVVVPVSDFLRLQALEQAASAQELEDAEDKAALADWRAREAAGQTSYIPHDEALRRPGCPARSSGRPRRSTKRPGSSATTPTGSVRCSTRSRGSPMSPALPDRSPTGHLTDGDCASAATG